MTNQRLVLIETNYGEGILFHQDDSALAYKILCRATLVRTGSKISPKEETDIDIKLVPPSRLMTSEEYQAFITPKAEPPPAISPALPGQPIPAYDAF